jgi:deoxyribonuclease IV
MKIGGHVSVSGGLLNAFERAQNIGANCFQIFVSSPRMWAVPKVDGATAKAFKEQLRVRDMNPSFVHIKYLVNIASPDNEVVKKSLDAVKQEMRLCSLLGLYGGMFHIGATKGGSNKDGILKVVEAVTEVMAEIPDNIFLLLENSASSKKIGSQLEEIAELLEKINHKRVAVCLDTAHAFAAGYDLRTEAGVDTFIDKVESCFGIEKVKLFHLNDSKSELGSGRDLHENIGDGKIGLAGFKALLNHKKTTQKAFIIETPGQDKSGPDRHNIEVLHNLVG